MSLWGRVRVSSDSWTRDVSIGVEPVPGADTGASIYTHVWCVLVALQLSLQNISRELIICFYLIIKIVPKNKVARNAREKSAAPIAGIAHCIDVACSYISMEVHIRLHISCGKWFQKGLQLQQPYSTDLIWKYNPAVSRMY